MDIIKEVETLESDGKIRVISYYRVALLVATLVVCVLFAFYVNIELKVEMVYTHLFYLPIILAGIWFYRKAAFVAIFLGAVHLLVGYVITGTILLSALARALMFLIVALVVGEISAKKDSFFEKLNISTQQNRVILQAVAEGIISTDLAGIVNYANPTALKMMGCQSEQIKAGVINFNKLLSATLQEHYLPRGITIATLASLSGQEIMVEYSSKPIYDQKGQESGAVVLLRDITERIRIDREMVRLDKLNLIGQMGATLAHELRNPLTTVLGLLQISLDKRQNFNQELTVLMIEELDRANAIITEFLALSKNPMSNPIVQNLNTIVQAVFQLTEAAAGKSGKQIEITCGAIPDVWVDAGEMRQLLLNLVNNALEATPAGGKISIKTYLEDNQAIVAVSDQGPGIADCVLEQIGTPFFTTKENGTGLGLAVCYSIALRNNALITIKTAETGTTFMVRFKATG